MFDKILEVFRPDVIVLQCGADSLSGDKLGGLNLTMHGHARCVQHVRSKHVPLMLSTSLVHAYAPVISSPYWRIRIRRKDI